MNKNVHSEAFLRNERHNRKIASMKQLWTLALSAAVIAGACILFKK